MTSVETTTFSPYSSQELPINPEENDPDPVFTAFDAVENMEPAPEIEYPKGFKFTMICLSVALALTLTGLDLNIVATAVPKITDDFKTITDIGWYSAAYRLTLCAFQFMFGKMYAVFSIKWVYISALVIFEAGALLCAVAPSSWAFVLGRAISGMGSAGVVAGCFTMITLSLPLRRRPVFGGAAAAVEEIASVCSPILGGLITDRVSWRWCFYINLPLGAVTMAIIIFFFQNPQIPYAEANDPANLSFMEKLARLDLLGTLVFVPGITCMLLGLQFGGSNYGWTDRRVIACFVLFAILLAIFGYWQWRRGDGATLPLRIIGHRSIMSGMWFSLCNSSTYSIIQYYVSPLDFDFHQLTTHDTMSRCRFISKPSEACPPPNPASLSFPPSSVS